MGLEALLEIDPRFGLVFLGLVLILTGFIIFWSKTVKTRVIATWDKHSKKIDKESERNDEQDVKLAVHDEKHHSHEKRLDRIEDDRTSSGTN